MKYFAISADVDTLTGLRLAGIEGELATDRREVESLVNRVVSDETVAVLIVTQPCYELCREQIDVIKLNALRPLVTVIPDASGAKSEDDYITRLIREAIGVRI